MKRTIYALLAAIFIFILGAFLFSPQIQAQPQYYNFQNVGASNNNFPLNAAAGKMSQWLFLANDFNQPSPLPTGKKITKIYLWVTAGGSATYTNLHILMKQDTITSFTSGSFYSGTFDTVYSQASISLTGAAGSWMSITLDRAFVYDPTKSLIVAVGQCGQTGTGQTIKQNGLANIRRVWSVGGCPFTPYAGGDGSVANFGVDVVDATPTFALPEILYYKFLNNPTTTTVKNYATAPPSGTTTATLLGHGMTAPGQFDSCLVGTSLTGTGSTHVLNTNWTTNVGTSSWTIGMWLGNLSNQTGTSACYLFGDPAASSFRCFWAGAGISTDTAILLRYTGMPDMRLPLTTLGSFYVHFVYDSATSTLKSYKNGVYVSQVTWTGINLTGTGPFKVGGYSTSANSIQTGMKLDEFRFYKRALGQAEITATWNANLGVVTGVTPIVTQVPKEYKLSQNYPNPFNPVTKINFSIPKSGFVTLKVYDALGREVSTLVSENKTTGNYTVDFNGSSFSSGAYFYRLEVNGYVDTKKMLLVK